MNMIPTQWIANAVETGLESMAHLLLRQEYRALFWIHFLRCIWVVNEFHFGLLVHFRFHVVGLFWCYFGFRVLGLGHKQTLGILRLESCNTDHRTWF